MDVLLREYVEFAKRSLASRSFLAIVGILGFLTVFVYVYLNQSPFLIITLALIGLLAFSILFSLISYRIGASPPTRWALEQASYEWVIEDIGGHTAKFTKTTVGRCISNDTTYIQEQSFGDGQPISGNDCLHNSGKIVDINTVNKTDFILVRLDKVYKAGDPFKFIFRRTLRDSFLGSKEWVSVLGESRSLAKLQILVKFPGAATVTRAWVTTRYRFSNDIHGLTPITPSPSSKKRPELIYTIRFPTPGLEYVVWWEWNGGEQAERSGGSHTQVES